MNSEWQKILSDAQEVVRGDALGPVFCPLTSETILHVTGDDAESFLQAQFSNDIAALELPGSQLTTWSSPKGRVITLLRVVKMTDGYLLRVPADLVELVLKRLRMYVQLPLKLEDEKGGLPKARIAKVTIEQRDDLVVAGVSGDKAVAALAGEGVILPIETDATVELASAGEFASGGWISRVRDDASGAQARYEIVAHSNQMVHYWNVLSKSCTAAAESVWRLQNIDAGIPSINQATTEAFVLQMLNLQHINGVSFKKGCFPGQEVVARMQYLGKLKRQMVRLQHTGSTVPAAGDEIFKADRDSAIGKVVDAVSVDGSSCRLLAVMAIAELSEKLYLDKNAEQPLELLDFPYETPLAD